MIGLNENMGIKSNMNTRIRAVDMKIHICRKEKDQSKQK